MNRKRFVIRNCYECSRNCTFHCFLHTSAGFRQASDGSATSAALSATANRQVQITVQLSTAAATAPALPAASRQPPGTPVAPQRRSLRSQIESQCLASARSLALLRSHYSHNSIRDSTKSSRTPCAPPSPPRVASAAKRQASAALPRRRTAGRLRPQARSPAGQRRRPGRPAPQGRRRPYLLLRSHHTVHQSLCSNAATGRGTGPLQAVCSCGAVAVSCDSPCTHP